MSFNQFVKNNPSMLVRGSLFIALSLFTLSLPITITFKVLIIFSLLGMSIVLINEIGSVIGFIMLLVTMLISILLLPAYNDYSYSERITPTTIVKNDNSITLISNNIVVTSYDISVYTSKNNDICKLYKWNVFGVRNMDMYIPCIELNEYNYVDLSKKWHTKR